MTIETLAMGIVSLVGIVLLAIRLAGRTVNRADAVDNGQAGRTYAASRNLTHNGAWQTPRMSESDRKRFGL